MKMVSSAPKLPDEAVPGQPTPLSATRIPQLLCLLAELPGGATLSHLSEQSGTPKSSLLALLRALTRNGFLQYREGRYGIGPETVKLASTIVAHRKFPDIAIPVVDALAKATGESSLLARCDTDAQAAVYIYRADSRSALRFIAEVGSWEPLYASAVGRALLAFQSEAWRKNYVARTKLMPLTPKTVRTKRDLVRLLAVVRRERVATSFEETIEGVAGIAAPIFDRSGDVLAGVVIGAPMARALPRIKSLQQQVSDAAAEISGLMGYSDARRPDG
jgi:DNA-binding IclR family transcriptional regulator